MSKKKILLLGDKNYSVRNERESEPFTGTNTFLMRQMVKQAGIEEKDIQFENLYKGDYYHERRFSRGFPQKYIETPSLKKLCFKLKDIIKKTSPNVIIVTHELPLFLLTGEHNIKKHRGTIMESTLVPNMEVIPTYHPRYLHKQWLMTYPVMCDLRKALAHSKKKGASKDTRTLIVKPSKNEFIHFCDYLVNDDEVKEIAFDIETQQPNAHISWIGFSASPDYAMSLKLISNRLPYFSGKAEAELWDAVSSVLTCGKPIIAHNGQYDMSVLWINNGILPTIAFDTMLASHCLWPQLPKSLGFVSSMLLDVRAWKHTSGQDMGQYNAEDVSNTHALYYALRDKLKEQGCEQVFNHEMSQLNAASFLGLNGLTINKDKLVRMREEYEAELSKVEKELNTLADTPSSKEVDWYGLRPSPQTKPTALNWNSGKQIEKLLYEKLGMPVQYNRAKSGKKKGQKVPTTDEGALRKLMLINDNPIMELILKYRGLAKMLSTYLNIDLEEGTDKVYTSFNIAGTKEGRWSSDASIIRTYGSGNLQNIPYEARKLYVPNGFKDEGFTGGIVSMDYCSAEAVAVAYIANDERSKEAFRKGYDTHRMAYADIFGGDWRDVTPSNRNKIGKPIRHMTNYDAGAKSLGEAIGCTIKDALEYKDKFLASNPHIPKYHGSVQRTLRKEKCLTNPFGRKYPLIERIDDPFLRSMYAFQPASLVGDMTNTTLVRFYEKYGHKWDIMLQLHDGIYFKVDDLSDTENVAELLHAIRSVAIQPIEINGDTMVIDIDFSIGKNWGDMVGLKLEDGMLKMEDDKGWRDYQMNLLKD